MKKLFFIIAFLVVLGGVAYVTVRTGGSSTPPVKGVFTSASLGLSFKYDNSPDGFVVRMVPQSSDSPAGYLGGLVLLRTADSHVVIRDGDGPPAISISVYDNPSQATADTWVQSSPWGNVRAGDAILPVVYGGGAQGVRYTSEGLYSADTVVLAKGTRIYLLVGMFDSQEAALKDAFAKVLSTLSLR
jgi:hypothetical protein